MIKHNLPYRPVILCILDGWGYRDDAEDNAISRTNAPVFWQNWDTNPHALLDASGEAVGLPKGQMGNSEVGHMNIGAGRVVLQDLPRIDRAITNGDLIHNPALLDLISKLKQSGGTCHLMGLASPGGVHSHQNHMVALARIVAGAGIPVAVHAFLDGRDVPPKSAVEQIAKLQIDLSFIDNARLSTMCGRYYAMDRDKRWERVEKAYDLLTQGIGEKIKDPIDGIKASYINNITDEFLLPKVLDNYAGMKNGDGILFTNFRADRTREILLALLDPDFSSFVRKKIVNFAVAAGMAEYSERLNGFMVTLFPPQSIANSMGEIVASSGLKQLRIAETEKYPHVTFFFNCGREEPYENEERIMVPSPKVATYDLKPEMSAFEVTDRTIEAINKGNFDFIVVNYANPDMVGHTGSMGAATIAVQTVDECLAKLFDAVRVKGGVMLLTADHGNCESMRDNLTRGPHTAHTLSRVPVVLINGPEDVKMLRNGKLADIAPTLLDLMMLPKPKEMEGNSLIVRKEKEDVKCGD